MNKGLEQINNTVIGVYQKAFADGGRAMAKKMENLINSLPPKEALQRLKDIAKNNINDNEKFRTTTKRTGKNQE